MTTLDFWAGVIGTGVVGFAGGVFFGIALMVWRRS
jgi:tetrahydromethanopterin S-methyltransferase subunit F